MNETRRILVDGRTPVNYAMFAPVHAAMRRDPRVRFTFVASDEPGRAREVFAGAGTDARFVSPRAAAIRPFDAYITSDFMWTRHLKRPCRIQMFHGVGGKYGFDAPSESMRGWDRLFFVNRRRLANFIKAGAIDADSAAIRLVGMPKVDCLVDGSIDSDAVIRSLGLDPAMPTVLYAPTWSAASSLNVMGEALIQRLLSLPINLIVKLHDRSRDKRPMYSGGIDWPARLRPRLDRPNAHLADAADICPLLAAADVMVTDHSSCGFEYLLLDRPLVRIDLPELIATANIHPDYVSLLASVSESVTTAAGAADAVVRALGHPNARSADRRAVAADLFHAPGRATSACATAIYEALELDPPPCPVDARGRVPEVDAPLVSVIMPAYNAERYLYSAAQSVLRQTHWNFELLIVDDGSSDGTLAAAEALARMDARVRVLSQDNAGPGPARNHGFRHAAGSLFALLDSDDEWDARFLEAQVAILRKRPDIDVVVANARYRGGARDGAPARPLDPATMQITLADILADENVLFIMTVFRREVIEAVGGFDPQFLTNEEYEMWIRAALAGYRFVRNPRPLGWYRCRPDSLSSSEVRMLTGIRRVLASTRPALPDQSPARAIVDRQLRRFERELATAQARACIAEGDVAGAANHLARVSMLSGSVQSRIAAALFQRAPAVALSIVRARARLRERFRSMSRRWAT
jgi:GT2 family glycosyltransferase